MCIRIGQAKVSFWNLSSTMTIRTQADISQNFLFWKLDPSISPLCWMSGIDVYRARQLYATWVNNSKRTQDLTQLKSPGWTPVIWLNRTNATHVIECGRSSYELRLVPICDTLPARRECIKEEWRVEATEKEFWFQVIIDFYPWGEWIFSKISRGWIGETRSLTYCLRVKIWNQCFDPRYFFLFLSLPLSHPLFL